MTKSPRLHHRPRRAFAALPLALALVVAALAGPGATPASAATSGYWLLRDDGVVLPFGTAGRHGDTGGSVPDKVVGMTVTPDGGGYWLAARNGVVYTFGNAKFFGSLAARRPAPIVTIAATASARARASEAGRGRGRARPSGGRGCGGL